MKYLKDSFSYVFKNFIFIFIFSLLPSYFLAFVQKGDRTSAFIASLFEDGAGAGFGDVFSFLSPFNAYGWIYSLVALILMIILLPMLTGFIERHMRLGVRSLKGILSRFNYNFVACFRLLLIFFVLYELWAVVAAGFIYLFVVLFNGVLCGVLASVCFALTLVLFCWILSAIILWLPVLQITGYRFMDSFVYEYQLYAGRRIRIFLAVLVPWVLGYVFAILSAFFVWPVSALLDFIIRELLFMVLILYYAVLMYVVYFAASGEERADLAKRYLGGSAR